MKGLSNKATGEPRRATRFPFLNDITKPINDQSVFVMPAAIRQAKHYFDADMSGSSAHS
jgi:hypothetical protein